MIVKNVSYQEIPSTLIYVDDFSVMHGINVIIEMSDRTRRVFISSSYKTDINEFELDPKVLGSLDMLAFHVYRYIKEECLFHQPCWLILWKLLRNENSLKKTIYKFISLIMKYYENNSDILD